MKWTRWLCAALLILVTVQGAAQAAEGAKPYQINNRLRVEYDDNIYQTDTNKTDSFKIIEEVELLVNFSLEKTFVSLRYRPSFVWWDKREPDETDFQNEVDLVINQKFTPRLTLSVVDTLRRGELPELIDHEVIVREQDDFWYNTVNATLGIVLRPPTILELSGRYIFLKYDSDVVATNEDFDLLVGGMTLRHSLVPQSTVLADLRAEQVEYEGVDRGSKTISAGLGWEQIFSPNFIGSLRGGYQNKQFNLDELGSESSPYADLVFTVLPSPKTRVSAGVQYSLFETDVYPFANQTRAQVFASLAYDITARVSWYLTGAFTQGQYALDDAVEPGIMKDADEDIYQASTRLTYKMNRNNWLEAGWQFVDFRSHLQRVDGSDLRQSFTQNRLDLGWKIQF